MEVRSSMLNTHTSQMYAILRICLAALSGVLVYASYQPQGISVAGIVGIALFYAALSPFRGNHISMRLGAGVAFTHCVVLYLLLLPWIGEFVGNFPYISLAVFLSLYGIILGIGAAAIQRLPHSWLWFAFLYLAVEWLRSHYPFGGFAWVRLAWGQVGSPLANLASIGGPALVTFVTVVLATGLYTIAFRRHVVPIVVSFMVIAVGTTWATATLGSSQSVGNVTVAAIQGNVPRLGLEFNAQRRAVLANHVTETTKLKDRDPVDLVIWPENSSDVNPFADMAARNLINQAVAAAQAPILVGTITRDEVGPRNTMVVFDPESGPGEFHHKKFLQPFGEYMPMRKFFRLFSEKVDLAGNFQPGNGTGVVQMRAATSGTPVTVGIATCYEVAFDAAARDAVAGGAQILTTPTNNATFNFSDMTYQQLAMSRMRAIEVDRAVVVAATSGVSAIVQPDGTVTQHSGIFEAKTLIETLPLRNSSTFAVRHGSTIEYTLVIIGWLAMIFALWRFYNTSAGSASAPKPNRKSPSRSKSAAAKKKNR